jgi:hypothetical protein
MRNESPFIIFSIAALRRPLNFNKRRESWWGMGRPLTKEKKKERNLIESDHEQWVLGSSTYTQHYTVMVNTPASHLGGPRLYSWPGD